jgi:hypothetical protein
MNDPFENPTDLLISRANFDYLSDDPIPFDIQQVLAMTWHKFLFHLDRIIDFDRMDPIRLHVALFVITCVALSTIVWISVCLSDRVLKIAKRLFLSRRLLKIRNRFDQLDKQRQNVAPVQPRYHYFVPGLDRLVSFQTNVILPSFPIESDAVVRVGRIDHHKSDVWYESTLSELTLQYSSLIYSICARHSDALVIERELMDTLSTSTFQSLSSDIVKRFFEYLASESHETTWLTSGKTIASADHNTRDMVIRAAHAFGTPYILSLWSMHAEDRYALKWRDWWIRQVEIETYQTQHASMQHARIEANHAKRCGRISKHHSVILPRHPVFGMSDPAFLQLTNVAKQHPWNRRWNIMSRYSSWDAHCPMTRWTNSSDCILAKSVPFVQLISIQPEHSILAPRNVRAPDITLAHHVPEWAALRQSKTIPRDLYVVGSSTLFHDHVDHLWVVTSSTVAQVVDWYTSVCSEEHSKPQNHTDSKDNIHPGAIYPVYRNDQPDTCLIVRPFPLRNIIVYRCSESIISFLCRQRCDMDAVAYHMASSKWFILDRARQAFQIKGHLVNLSTQWEHRQELIQWLQCGYHLAVPGLVPELIRCCNIADPYYLLHSRKNDKSSSTDTPVMDMLDYLYMTECNDIVEEYENRRFRSPMITSQIIQSWKLLPLSNNHDASHTFYTRAYDCYPKTNSKSS